MRPALAVEDTSNSSRGLGTTMCAAVVDIQSSTDYHTTPVELTVALAEVARLQGKLATVVSQHETDRRAAAQREAELR